jgi:hypothetical protein
MTWLLLTYFLSLGTLSYQAVDVDHVWFSTPPLTFQTTLGLEAQLFNDHVFVGAGVQTWESAAGNGFFNPMESLFTFSVGLRGWGFELGYRHECDHPIISSTDFHVTQGWLATKNEIYLSYTGKLKVF